MASPTHATIGTTTNHQNNVQIILSPSPSGTRNILTPDLRTEQLFDGAGLHLGGVYPPLVADNVLTSAHARCVSTRPAQLLIHGPACDAPGERIGLVWMMPADRDAFMAAMEVAPWLVYALDAGWSVQVHAADDQAIADAWMVVSAMTGGGHT